MTKLILPLTLFALALPASASANAPTTPLTVAEAKASIMRSGSRSLIRWCHRESQARIKCGARIVIGATEVENEEGSVIGTEPVFAPVILELCPKGIVWKDSEIVGMG